MAGIKLNVNSGEVVLVAATPKTLLQLKAPANQRLVLKGLRMLGKQPAGGTDTPVKIRLTRSTANFGTGSSATPGKSNPSLPETVQSVVFANFSVEPTSPTDAGVLYEVAPQSGVIEFLSPDQQLDIPGGASLNVEATSNGTPTLVVTATYEE